MTTPDLTPVPLSPERLAEIREREQAATSGPWGTYFDRVVYDVVADLQPTGSGYRCRRQIAELRDEPIDNDPAHRDWTAEEDASQIFHDATFITRAREDVPALLAEVDRLTAERDRLAHELDGTSLSLWEEEQENARLFLAWGSARMRARRKNEALKKLRKRVAEMEAELVKYVGKEPTIAEEMQYVGSCLDAVYDLVNGAKKRGHEVVTTAEVEQAASGDWPRAPKDNRRSIYVDGKGNAWIDAGKDESGAQDIAGITDGWRLRSAEEVRVETGGLREIGRCW
jgi:hypothetical protein